MIVLFLHVPPPPQKLSLHAFRGVGRSQALNRCLPPSPHPVAASEIKQTFLSTHLACLLAFKWRTDRAAPHTPFSHIILRFPLPKHHDSHTSVRTMSVYNNRDKTWYTRGVCVPSLLLFLVYFSILRYIYIFCFSLWSLHQNISSHGEYLNYLCKHSEDISCSLHSVYCKVHQH